MAGTNAQRRVLPLPGASRGGPRGEQSPQRAGLGRQGVGSSPTCHRGPHLVSAGSGRSSSMEGAGAGRGGPALVGEEMSPTARWSGRSCSASVEGRGSRSLGERQVGVGTRALRSETGWQLLAPPQALGPARVNSGQRPRCPGLGRQVCPVTGLVRVQPQTGKSGPAGPATSRVGVDRDTSCPGPKSPRPESPRVQSSRPPPSLLDIGSANTAMVWGWPLDFIVRRLGTAEPPPSPRRVASPTHSIVTFP